MGLKKAVAAVLLINKYPKMAIAANPKLLFFLNIKILLLITQNMIQIYANNPT